MNFKNSRYYISEKFKTYILPFGKFYMCDVFCLSEINEGLHVGLEEIQNIFIVLLEHYGEDLKIGYISNRINHYSIDTTLWTKLNNDYKILVAEAIVFYDDLNYYNASIEKKLSTYSVKRCSTLFEAINYMDNLSELKYS